MKITFCAKCVYPSTKPDLTFNEEGVCSACLAYEGRKNIDWQERSFEFAKLVNKTREQRKILESNYDCIIPVSGGKDSHFQVLMALKNDLKPLAITATTDHLSDIGRDNLDNISRLGVDHIIISVNPIIRRRIAKYALETIGDISWAEHITIFTVPMREAILRKIPLIVWGENPQNEYGGPNQNSQSKKELDNSWLYEFGGLNGLRVQDIIDAGIASEEDMFQYKRPGNSGELVPFGGVFLGYYFPWDGFRNAKIAEKHGFKWAKETVSGTGVPYENLDNYQTGIHDYFKWLKFGFGRATDIACNFIRRDILDREAAIRFIKRYDGEFPSFYLGKSLEEILKNIDMTVDDFMKVCDKFTNYQLFEPRVGSLQRPVPKFTVE